MATPAPASYGDTAQVHHLNGVVYDDGTGTPKVASPLQPLPVRVAQGPNYETVAASQTDQVMGGAGAVGDVLTALTVVVATAATSVVQIKDGGGSAVTVFPANPTNGVGTYYVQLGLTSAAGAWKVTTGAGVSVIASGTFT